MTTHELVDVKVEQGVLRGQRIVLEDGQTYDAFRGVPYAQKPVGALRFKAPRTPEPWEGIRSALEEGPVSAQLDRSKSFIGSEDCLYLNVYTPRVPSSPTTDSTESLRDSIPIMVWFHPGLFRGGSGSSAEYGPEYLLAKNVVVVTVNYRLGAFGFLSLESPAATGNYALKDVVASLRWVKNNGCAFGGDIGRVTAFGCSAGGVIVQLLQRSPSAKGLFHRAIAQSGSGVNPVSIRSKPRERALRLARQLGASQLGAEMTDDHTILQFLRAQSPQDIVAASAKILALEDGDDNARSVFGPVSEENMVPDDPEDVIFLPRLPYDLLGEKRVSDVPLIMGMVSKEGLVIDLLPKEEAGGVKAVPEVLRKFDKELERVLPSEMKKILPHAKQKEAANRLRQLYFGGGAVCEESKAGYYDLISDLVLSTGILQEARSHARTADSPVYVYLFGVRGNMNRISQAMKIRPEEAIGACHGDELSYIWNTRPPLPAAKELDPQSVEAKTRERIVTLWTNFAKTGNPTPEGQTVEGVRWPPLPKDVESRIPYLDLDVALTVPKAGLYEQRVAFWDSLYFQLDSK